MGVTSSPLRSQSTTSGGLKKKEKRTTTEAERLRFTRNFVHNKRSSLLFTRSKVGTAGEARQQRQQPNSGVITGMLCIGIMVVLGFTAMRSLAERRWSAAKKMPRGKKNLISVHHRHETPRDSFLPPSSHPSPTGSHVTTSSALSPPQTDKGKKQQQDIKRMGNRALCHGSPTPFFTSACFVCEATPVLTQASVIAGTPLSKAGMERKRESCVKKRKSDQWCACVQHLELHTALLVSPSLCRAAHERCRRTVTFNLLFFVQHLVSAAPSMESSLPLPPPRRPSAPTPRRRSAPRRQAHQARQARRAEQRSTCR